MYRERIVPKIFRVVSFHRLRISKISSFFLSNTVNFTFRILALQALRKVKFGMSESKILDVPGVVLFKYRYCSVAQKSFGIFKI